MKVGLLWYDDDPKHSLTDKITRAATRYRQKFGQRPNICYVHHSALSGNANDPPRVLAVPTQVGQIQLATSPTILPHHLWIGQEDQP